MRKSRVVSRVVSKGQIVTYEGATWPQEKALRKRDTKRKPWFIRLFTGE